MCKYANEKVSIGTKVCEIMHNCKDFKKKSDIESYVERFHMLEEDFTELVMKSENICNYCKNNITCKGKECAKYIEGRGCWDDKRCHHDWVWSCRDFDFGTCEMLENTPCNGCFKNNYNGFEWRGNS